MPLWVVRLVVVVAALKSAAAIGVALASGNAAPCGRAIAGPC